MSKLPENVRVITQPVTPAGNDAADWQDNPEAVAVFKKSVESAFKPEVFDLGAFALNGSAAEMKTKMLDDKYILGRMAILGQSTAMYAKPNAGKTLLSIWLLIQAIESGEIRGEDIFYINADDNHKGLTYKLELAEKHGFLMLAPGYNNFQADMLTEYLATLVKQDTASGKILILDTVKKFTDLMRKDKSSAFGEAVRQFVSHGGSMVMLAHVNKHRGDDGKVVPGGTSDLVDDADCAYTLDVVTDDKQSGIRTVTFENFKSRGDVAQEEVYQYDYSEGSNYGQRLDSVRALTDQERAKAEKKRTEDTRLEINREAIDAIRECLLDGVARKTELIKEAAIRTGIARKKIILALEEHTGSKPSESQFWHLIVEDKNAHVYRLNYSS
jgi:hypothetical protein